jgi:outer membrane immunogenic protein
LSSTNTEARWGWAAGAGINYGFANWVAGLEWLHYDLGHSSTTATANVFFGGGGAFPVPGASLTASQRVSGDIVRATLSYKLN